MMQNFLYEEGSFGVFLLVTVILGGGAAALAGRAIAVTWRPWWQIVLYVMILGGAVRFIHFALFGGTLLSPHYYAVDTALCLASGLVGFQAARAAALTAPTSIGLRRAQRISLSVLRNPHSQARA